MTLAQMALSSLDWTLAARRPLRAAAGGAGARLPDASRRLPARAGRGPREPRAGRARRLRDRDGAAARAVAPRRRRARLRARLPHRLLPDPARAGARALRRLRGARAAHVLARGGRLARAVAPGARAARLRGHDLRGRRVLLALGRDARRRRRASSVLERLLPLPRARALALPRQRDRRRASCCSRARCSSASTRPTGSRSRCSSAARSRRSLKGLDWEEALVLARDGARRSRPCRRCFYRRSSLLAQSFSPAWIAGIALLPDRRRLRRAARVPATSTTRTSCGGSSRSTRTRRARCARSRAARSRSPRFALARLLRPAPPPRRRADADDARARRAARRRRRAARSAHLALLGDKRLLFHESGAGFLMYGVQRRSWVAMGDPVGPPDVRRELAWQFRELADRHGGARRLLRGRRRGPARLPRPRARPAQARRGGARAARRLLARGRRAARGSAPRTTGWRATAAASRSSPRDGRAARCCPRCARSPTSGSRARTRARSASRSAASTRDYLRALSARRSCATGSGSSPSRTSGRRDCREELVPRPDALRRRTRRPA